MRDESTLEAITRSSKKKYMTQLFEIYVCKNSKGSVGTQGVNALWFNYVNGEE